MFPDTKNMQKMLESKEYKARKKYFHENEIKNYLYK